jgi:hypothetical protein
MKSDTLFWFPDLYAYLFKQFTVSKCMMTMNDALVRMWKEAVVAWKKKTNEISGPYSSTEPPR